MIDPSTTQSTTKQTDGQNQTVQEAVERIRRGHDELRRELMVFNSRPHEISDALMQFVCRKQVQTVESIDRVLRDDSIGMTDSFIQFDPHDAPEQVVKNLDIPVDVAEEELRSMISRSLRRMIEWTHQLSAQQDLPDSARESITALAELQERELKSLMEGLESFRVGQGRSST